MKQRLYGFGIAMLAALCVARQSDLYAQEKAAQDKGPLAKPVTVKADRERLADVLDDLAKKGYFTFSYQSDILNKDRLVTLTIRESTLREALELILGRTYDLVESGDYVIIRRQGAVAAKKALWKARMSQADTIDVGDIREKMPENEVLSKMKMKKAGQIQETKAKKSMWAMKRGMPYLSDSLDTKDSLNLVKLKLTVRYIVDDMIADGIIKDKSSFTWFALDNGQFVVDGRHLADSLRVKYATKFVGPDGSGYYCGTLSGVTGRGYFFDKKEIYGDGAQ
jgi:hypothetical protein